MEVITQAALPELILFSTNFLKVSILTNGPSPGSIKIRGKEFKGLLKGRSIYSLIFDMHVDGAKKNKKETVLIKEFQRDPITREFLNVDFLRIQMEKEIETTVPIHIINEEVAVGIKEGDGVLQHGLRELHISCFPADIPEYIEYDIKNLDMGVAVRISDINISDKIKILNDPEEVVVSIIQPTQLKEEEVVEEGAEEEIAEPEVIGKEKVEPEEEDVKQKEEGHSREKDSREK
ncbi:hypothetical protein ES708_08236 [subsurface metagenome]